ncbi:MAG: Ig-like domain-containing protein [Bacteroidales bacterium]|nr:Ig-like domain-containing protein [Bacteroidales bacterium]
MRVNFFQGKTKTVVWSSSSEKIATAENGVITGVSYGTATITARSGSESTTCAVTVLSNSNDGVYARSLGGSVVNINGKIQGGSKLNFGIYNYTAENITVVSAQLVNGITLSEGNVMSLNTPLAPGSSTAWSFTVGALGIQSPIIRFVYLYKEQEFTCEAKY